MLPVASLSLSSSSSYCRSRKSFLLRLLEATGNLVVARARARDREVVSCKVTVAGNVEDRNAARPPPNPAAMIIASRRGSRDTIGRARGNDRPMAFRRHCSSPRHVADRPAVSRRKRFMEVEFRSLFPGIQRRDASGHLARRAMPRSPGRTWRRDQH